VRDVTPVQIDGRPLDLTNLDKVLYPDTGFTKADVLRWVVRVAPVLLPHLAGRPLTLKRYPDGVDGEYFYEKNCPEPRPDWVRTVVVPGGHKGTTRYVVVDDLPTLVWVTNLGSLELHPLLARAPSLDRPTSLVFDLDPGPPAGIVECARVALLLRDLLERGGLAAFPKTSGNKGLQLYVPLNAAGVGFDDTKTYAHAAAIALERRYGALVVSRMSKALRPGRVFVDWAQNDAHKTTVSVYSLRAARHPTVSTPVTWDEVALAARRSSPASLSFEWSDVQTRVMRHGDLFAPVLSMQQHLPGTAAFSDEGTAQT
jgi:bifunctional non-homologous end joining protein LigD